MNYKRIPVVDMNTPQPASVIVKGRPVVGELIVLKQKNRPFVFNAQIVLNGAPVVLPQITAEVVDTLNDSCNVILVYVRALKCYTFYDYMEEEPLCSMNETAYVANFGGVLNREQRLKLAYN